MNFKNIRSCLQKFLNNICLKSLSLLSCYIANIDADPQMLIISTKHLAEKNEYISENYSLVNLHTLFKDITINKISNIYIVIFGNSPKYQICLDLHECIINFPYKELQYIIDKFYICSRFSRNGYSIHLIIKCNNLHKLELWGPISAGAHTLNHPIFSAHSTETQGRGIIENNRFLKDILNHAVNIFSYHFSGNKDFNNQKFNILRKFGFDFIDVNYNGFMIRPTNPNKSRRYLFWNSDINLLSQKNRGFVYE